MFPANKRHSDKQLIWAVVDVLSASYVRRSLGVHLIIKLLTRNVYLLNIATNTQPHLIYLRCVRGTSFNSGSSFRCRVSHLVGSCFEQWKCSWTLQLRRIATVKYAATIYILRNIATHTSHHLIGSLCVRGSSLNSLFGFGCPRQSNTHATLLTPFEHFCKHITHLVVPIARRPSARRPATPKPLSVHPPVYHTVYIALPITLTHYLGMPNPTNSAALGTKKKAQSSQSSLVRALGSDVAKRTAGRF